LIPLVAAACGNLDERDTNPPSVDVLTRWDSSHVLALLTYKSEADVVDLASGRVTKKVKLDKYYNDIQALGGDRYVAVHNQTIDFVAADGTVEAGRSIAGHIFGGIAVSGDGTTLAYSDSAGPNQSSLTVLNLQDGMTHVLSAEAYNSLSNTLADGFALSYKGDLLAIAGGVIDVMGTNGPSPTTSTCAPTYPDHGSVGAPETVAFSPVTDELASGSLTGEVEFFAPVSASGCTSRLPIPTPDSSQNVQFVRYSPSGTTLAVVSSALSSTEKGVVVGSVTKIRLRDVATGALITELETYRWEQPAGQMVSYPPILTDLLWTDAGDGLVLSASEGPLQFWDLTTGALRWELSL